MGCSSVISTVKKRTQQGKAKMVVKGGGPICTEGQRSDIELDLYEMKKMGGDLGRESSKCNSPEVGLSFARNSKKSSVGREAEGRRKLAWPWKGRAAPLMS